jgi:hypothetical protein
MTILFMVMRVNFGNMKFCMLFVYEDELDFLYTWKLITVSGRTGVAYKLLRFVADPHFSCY